MSDSASTTTLQAPERIPTGSQVFDALMGEIEPELVTSSIPHLEEKYADESEENRRARYLRYEVAFEQYELAFANWSTELLANVTLYKREALKSAEETSRAEEKVALQNLEAAMT